MESEKSRRLLNLCTWNWPQLIDNVKRELANKNSFISNRFYALMDVSWHKFLDEIWHVQIEHVSHKSSQKLCSVSCFQYFSIWWSEIEEGKRQNRKRTWLDDGLSIFIDRILHFNPFFTADFLTTSTQFFVSNSICKNFLRSSNKLHEYSSPLLNLKLQTNL